MNRPWHGECFASGTLGARIHFVAAQSEPDVRRAADEIRAWFQANPRAAETLRGIVQWWLMQQRFEEAWHTVELALGQLMEEGVVKRTILPDGGALYSSASEEKHS
jgi:hypothetical protein